MVAVDVKMLERSTCPSCGATGQFTYSPREHLFYCGGCADKFLMPELPGVK